MSKKSDQLMERDRIIHKLGDAIEEFLESLSLNESLPQLYKHSKAHQQVLEQALKFHNEKKYEKALPLFLELAEHGSEEGAEYAAMYYEEGLGTRKSQKNAFLIYRKGKKSGSIYCYYRLGYCYLYGKGTRKDENKGLELIEESALMGCKEAIWFLIDLFSSGSDFVEIDDDVVDFWMKKADIEVGQA